MRVIPLLGLVIFLGAPFLNPSFAKTRMVKDGYITDAMKDAALNDLKTNLPAVYQKILDKQKKLQNGKSDPSLGSAKPHPSTTVKTEESP